MRGEAQRAAELHHRDRRAGQIIDPLTNPTSHGASAEDAFHLVIPSPPGHGFSGKPTATGWDPVRTARAWAERAYRNNLLYFNEVDKGGHFAAWDQPQLFSEEMRASFRTLRK